MVTCSSPCMSCEELRFSRININPKLPIIMSMYTKMGYPSIIMSMYTVMGYPQTHGTIKKDTHFEGEYSGSRYPKNVKKIAYTSTAFIFLRTTFVFWYSYYSNIFGEVKYLFLGFRPFPCEAAQFFWYWK